MHTQWHRGMMLLQNLSLSDMWTLIYSVCIAPNATARKFTLFLHQHLSIAVVLSLYHEEMK